MEPLRNASILGHVYPRPRFRPPASGLPLSAVPRLQWTRGPCRTEHAMSGRPQVRYTYRDYLSIPEDNSRRHEIVDGELFVTPAPRFRHQQVVADPIRLLRSLAIEHELGDVALRAPSRRRLHAGWRGVLGRREAFRSGCAPGAERTERGGRGVSAGVRAGGGRGRGASSSRRGCGRRVGAVRERGGPRRGGRC